MHVALGDPIERDDALWMTGSGDATARCVL